MFLGFHDSSGGPSLPFLSQFLDPASLLALAEASIALPSVETLKLLSIPLVAAIVGWFTNWAAIRLTFWPVEFIGRKPFLGWQGIIPAKAERMASIFVDSTMDRLGTLPELFREMQPERIAEHIVETITPRLPAFTDEILRQQNPVLWKLVPNTLKKTVTERVVASFPHRVDRLVSEANERIDELIDFKAMIVSRLVDDRALLNRLFIESGKSEFDFIVRSGLHFGFLFGLVQLAAWTWFGQPWILPVFGLLVGFATNWIALNLIFRPLEPKKIGPFTLQGLFLKRQPEVAAVWCRLVTREIVTIRSLVLAMLHGPRKQVTRELIVRHMKPLVREAAGPYEIPAQIVSGEQQIATIEDWVATKSLELSTTPFDDWQFNRERAVVVEALLRERMEGLPPDEFQDLLRPCFQEDELTLILVGAGLGFLAGLGQLILVFGGG